MVAAHAHRKSAPAARHASKGLPAGNPPADKRLLLGAAAIVLLALVLLAVLAHGPSIRGEFLWDDSYFIRNNPVAAEGRAPWGYWYDRRMSDYFPVTSTFFYLETRLFNDPAANPREAGKSLLLPEAGADPFPAMRYRAVNVALHALACVMVFLVLRALRLPGAWLGAALFAVHPVTAASVGWISEQKNTLSLIFYALAMLAYLRFDATGRWGLYALAAVAFALALLTKASTVVLPAVLLVVLWWRRRPLRTWRTGIPLAGLFALGLAAGVAMLWFHAHIAIAQVDVGAPHGAFARVLTAAKALWFYAAKAVVPVNLSMVYPKWDASRLDWTVAAIPGILAWGAILLVFRRRPWARDAAAASACFMLSLSPVLGLVNMSFMQFSYVSDHLAYLALPVATVTGAAIGAALARRSRTWRIGMTAAGAAVLVVLGLATVARAKVFSTNRNLWSDTAAKNPAAWIAHDNLAAIAEHDRQDSLALREYDLAIAHATPGHAVRYRFRQANVLFRLNKLAEARHVLEGSAWDKADDPADRVLGRQLLALVLQKLGEYELARQMYEAVLAESDVKVPGGRVTTLNNLADLLSENLGQPQAAVEYARQAVQLAPNAPFCLDTLGWAYYRVNQLDLAQQHLSRAVSLQPAAAYCYHLGMVLEARGHKSEALRQYRLGQSTEGPDASDEYYARIQERIDALQRP